MVTAESDTATASAARYPIPTSRTRTPCAVARSELIELRISGRYIASTMPAATTLKIAMTGTIDDGSVKIDPKRTLMVAPVVLDAVESRYRNRAASPSAAPSTIPVARSRPRGRRIPIHSITPAAMRFMATNPNSGLIPSRNAADPPAVPMSASE